jgi:outer membrane protein TolC
VFGIFQFSFFPSLFILLLLCISNGIAQSSVGILSLQRCIELAQNAPSSVRRAREQLDAAKFGQAAARAGFFPQLSISNGFTYNSPLLYDRSVFSFVALNGVHEYSSVANSTLEVDTSGRLRAIYERARANRQIAEVDVTLSERDLERAISMAYYRVLLTRKLVASAEDNAQAARDFETKVNQLIGGGEASRADLTKASLERTLLERTAESMKIEAEKAEHDLASYWTTNVTSKLLLADDLDQPPPAPTLPTSDDAYLKRPEFQLFAAQIAGFKADAHQARALMLPQLHLSFQYGIDSTHATSRDRGYAGFAHLDIPVFDFFRAHSEQRQFKSQALAAQTDESIGKRLFSKEYQDALSDVKGTYAQIVVAQRQLNLAKDNLTLSRLRFEGGEGTALDVVTAQSAFVQAEIDFYTTRANYLNAQSALKVASGQ